MSYQIQYVTPDLEITPNRKRKRNSDQLCDALPESSTFGISNAAFSTIRGKENAFKVNQCLEVKSISDIVSNKKAEAENPYEVVRRPPKKKKKALIEKSCFVNPALNLEIAGEEVNPFEVKRSVGELNCFTNSGLNILTADRVEENPSVRLQVQANFPLIKEGIENPALELPTPLTIGIPFTPRVGCRIDFRNVHLPSNDKLKISANELISKSQALPAITEETVDIGRELDSYQLELENSINEAKQRKKVGNMETLIEEDVEAENEEVECKGEKNISAREELSVVKEIETKSEESPEKTSNEMLNTKEEDVDEANDSRNSVDSFTDEEQDFKAPAPFVRAYRKPEVAPTPFVRAYRKPEVASAADKKPDEKLDKKGTVSGSIRKSIRRMMHLTNTKENHTETEEKPATQKKSGHILDTIRHSLRRRPKKVEESAEEEEMVSRDISIIIDCAERVKFKSNSVDARDEQVTTEVKSLFRSSIRKSTRGVRNQVMKSVFKKNVEEYTLRD